MENEWKPLSEGCESDILYEFKQENGNIFVGIYMVEGINMCQYKDGEYLTTGNWAIKVTHFRDL